MRFAGRRRSVAATERHAFVTRLTCPRALRRGLILVRVPARGRRGFVTGASRRRRAQVVGGSAAPLGVSEVDEDDPGPDDDQRGDAPCVAAIAVIGIPASSDAIASATVLPESSLCAGFALVRAATRRSIRSRTSRRLAARARHRARVAPRSPPRALRDRLRPSAPSTRVYAGQRTTA